MMRARGLIVGIGLICRFSAIKVWQRNITGSSASQDDHRVTDTDIVERLRLARVINATGTVTRLGASPIDPQVIAAMAAAAHCSVDMANVQGRASEVISL